MGGTSKQMGIFKKVAKDKPIGFHLATAAMLYGSAINHQYKNDIRYLGETLASIMDFWVSQTGEESIRLSFDLYQPDMKENRYSARYTLNEVRETFRYINESSILDNLTNEWYKYLASTDSLPLIEHLMKIGGMKNEYSNDSVDNDRTQSVLGVVLEVLGECKKLMLQNENRSGEMNQEGEDAFARGLAACTIGALLLTFHSREED
jgi:hypothetical protein